MVQQRERISLLSLLHDHQFRCLVNWRRRRSTQTAAAPVDGSLEVRVLPPVGPVADKSEFQLRMSYEPFHHAIEVRVASR